MIGWMLLFIENIFKSQYSANSKETMVLKKWVQLFQFVVFLKLVFVF